MREQHLALGDQMKAAGQLVFATAMLNEEGNMSGSVMIFEMESRKELDEYLQKEPYVTGNVWKDIEIKECKVGSSFV